MRILLVADLHGNWPALQAIKEPFDLCFCLGDLVDYALEPAACIEWVRKNATHAVRGNHDHGVAQNIAVSGRNGFKYLNGVTRVLTRELLNLPQTRFLASMPITRMVSVQETKFLLVHASPRDPLDEYAPADVAYWEKRLQNVEADVVCVGHTHQPYVLEVGNKIVINPGSVGQPRDGDPRASYAIIDNFRIELKRIEYPVEQTVEVIRKSALANQAKDLLTDVLRLGGKVQPVNGNGQH